ncbi:unnamed protein product [Cylindrotheca closterium]|uniref:Uncharacterized protein n=1 Tax=Cylindrotheca closterium TaxID=2856 RepID=A0AAD2JH22_9STRA|nr:unnamed protein product [Cylindrotheca closterium]
MADPSGFVTSPPSTYVKIINTARAEMNGQFGLVLGYSEERTRYVLVLCNNGAQAMLRPENLEPCSTVEKYQAQYQQIRNDPRIKQKMTELYGNANQMLGGRAKPEHAAGAMGVVFLLLIYFVGFSKMIMLTSLIMLVGLIVAPDIQAFGIKKWKLILRNFPTRCRETIEQTVPQARGRVTNPMACGFVLFMILVAGRTLFLSSGKAPSVAPNPPMMQEATRTATRSLLDTTTTTTTAKNAIDEAYKMGYNDATSSLPFGTASLAELKEQVSAATSASSVPPTQDILYDYPPPPPPQKSGGFGMGSIMSLFMIGRTCMQNGMTGDGNFDPQLLLANLQLMPMPQKAILGFSVFNLLRAFL